MDFLKSLIRIVKKPVIDPTLSRVRFDIAKVDERNAKQPLAKIDKVRYEYVRKDKNKPT